ncbi:ABC-type transport auxiliary lipoprotein family protein [Arsukibacterium sp.]|uniref:ABC-type transport auxiliary lipoprotein family protein n=1 Tax=Arsukibacterium sp. TaxID=1977258 RepID=UPI00299CE2A0|nr:ABC-type transport auxiliary lipoprotein family protein [Arsukibacterium sp.]MDX1678477.1 ABC-type transport auxiliary lipoprotein family protein [Arsukibacterium sp.]
MNRQLLKTFNLLLTLLLPATLAGCSIIPQPKTVQLLDPQLATPAVRPVAANWRLNVNRPVTDPVRDSNQVLVRTRQGQLQVHPSARWVAASPDLLRTLLIRYLRDSQALQLTASATAGLDHTLALDLRQFEVVEDNNQLQARIKLEARLYDNRSARLLSRQLFARQQPLPDMQPAQLVSGFEAVLQQLIPAITDWLTDDPGSGQNSQDNSG